MLWKSRFYLKWNTYFLCPKKEMYSMYLNSLHFRVIFQLHSVEKKRNKEKKKKKTKIIKMQWQHFSVHYPLRPLWKKPQPPPLPKLPKNQIPKHWNHIKTLYQLKKLHFLRQENTRRKFCKNRGHKKPILLFLHKVHLCTSDT